MVRSGPYLTQSVYPIFHSRFKDLYWIKAYMKNPFTEPSYKIRAQITSKYMWLNSRWALILYDGSVRGFFI